MLAFSLGIFAGVIVGFIAFSLYDHFRTLRGGSMPITNADIFDEEDE